MKKKVLIMPLFLICLASMANDSKNKLVVWQTDGSCVLYDLDECPKTTFSGSMLIISTTKVNVEFPMDKVSHFTFELSSVGIEDPHGHIGITLKQSENELIIYNLPKGKKASVYTVDGKLLCIVQSTGQKHTLLPLQQLTTGTYIVKTDNITYKIYKR